MERLAASDARWNWLRLILRWGVLPVLREIARFSTFVGALVVASTLLLWLSWGTMEPELRQVIIELGAHLERANP